MSLLSDLVDGASGDQAAVSTLLRKVKVIAARLKTGELETWVEHELVGYEEDDPLPEYRGPFDAQVYGHFTGPFGSQYTNAPIPSIGFPENLRKGHLFHLTFPQPIAELERLAATTDGVLSNDWQADAVAYTNQLIKRGEVQLYEGMYLAQATRRVSPQQIHAIVDTVRTRILDLALALERLAPNAGETGDNDLDPSTLRPIVMNVWGGAQNIALGSRDFEQTLALLQPGDTAGLFAYLTSIGVSDDDLEELRTALDADAQEQSGLGPRVREWIGTASLKAAQAAGTGAASAIASLAVKAISAHFGI